MIAHMLIKVNITTLCYQKVAPKGDDDSNLVLEVGLEPTKPYGGRFTVSCDCHYTIPA